MWIILAGATVVGLTLGLLGSGGSILTVPVLTYLLGHDSKIAIAESLAIVGGIALVATIPYARAKLIDWRSVLWFGIPGMAGTYLGAWIAGWVSGAIQLILFAIVMLVAAYMMARGSGTQREKQAAETDEAPTEDDSGTGPALQSWWKIVLEGLAVGVLTGLVGVGGGFLIVPALVILGKLPMRIAVGTSLAVISLKSAAGLFKYVEVLQGQDMAINWEVIGLFILIGVVGSILGKMISSRLNQQLLRRGFAAFLVLMGLFVLGKESLALLEADPEPSTAYVESIESPQERNE